MRARSLKSARPRIFSKTRSRIVQRRFSRRCSQPDQALQKPSSRGIDVAFGAREDRSSRLLECHTVTDAPANGRSSAPPRGFRSSAKWLTIEKGKDILAKH